MRNFFKIFFATLLALVVFTIIGFFLMLGIAAAITSKDKPSVGSNAVLVLDLSTKYQDVESPKLSIQLNLNKISTSPPNLHEVVSMIRYAAKDKDIAAIYLKAKDNPNGFAASSEIRRALSAFKASGKQVIAFAPTMTQKAYYVASVASKVYVSPQGGVQWNGLVTQMMYFKGLLDKLEIHPEIFYAGKFKSATEPFRADHMSDANRLQTKVWLGELYGHMLQAVAKDRKVDSATLHELANEGLIQSASDALHHHLVDSLLYTDQVDVQLHDLAQAEQTDKLNLITIDKYNDAADYKDYSGQDRIALLVAQGEIRDGEGQHEIMSDYYVSMLRKLRKDSSVKAVVLRVNSPGGSALASDLIWREITLTKKVKPVVISMGDMAASGGYYISCNGSFIFAEPNTITGSIGVFTMTGNAGKFFQNKLGITFDEVKTATYADLGTISRPMTAVEKNMMQSSVDSVYHTFKKRVAEGRHKSMSYIDSIAQGRVWTGQHALRIGLVDSLGGLNDAIKYTAGLIHSDSYRISMYPEKRSILTQLLHAKDDGSDPIDLKVMAGQLSPELATTIQQVNSLKIMMNTIQTKVPFEFTIR